MNAKQRITTLATACALAAVGTAAQAQTFEDMSFAGMVRMERMDKNKDGMVSKAEFLEMMGKAWDMKTKEMKLKDGQANAQELAQA